MARAGNKVKMFRVVHPASEMASQNARPKKQWRAGPCGDLLAYSPLSPEQEFPVC